MCRVVRRYKSHPRIRELAVSLTNHLPDRAWYEEANALFAFVRDTIRYVFDPVEVEYVMAPDVLLDTGAGDCDDKSTLFACLLASIGHPSRFVVCGFESRGVYEHVYVETLIGERWIPGDCTQEFPFGWSPPNPLSVMRFHT
jgi:transglutaminase-like putative cysteine protease